jgi:hypothetical protein
LDCLSDPLDDLRKSVFADALSWSEEEGTSKFVGGNGNRLVSFIYFPSLFALGIY